MGLFDAIRKQLLKVIEWKDDSTDTLVYRYPIQDSRDEIMNGCQLIVTESQVAILVKDGQIGDIFGPGKHKLETKNLPILTKIAGWKYGFDSPFKADVYYVNTKQFINQQWGTTNPVMMNDREFGPVRIRAYGKYAYRVTDAGKFMKEIFGTKRDYSTSALADYFKSMVVTGFSSCLSQASIPVLEIAGKYYELAELIKQKVQEDFSEIGLTLVELFVENVSLPKEVEETIDKRTSVGIMSDKMGSYVTYEAAGAMRDAAKNEGNGMAGAGMGFGAGAAMGQMMSEALKNAKDEEPKPSKTATKKCPKCASEVAATSKFCPECGEKLPVNKFCPECGKEVNAGAKFCPECGNKLN
ncbi:MAG: SPFH domain-containing protein [Bacilli bacterium]|nr:SPFH domain-containing protein [Bacilli bacterium]